MNVKILKSCCVKSLVFILTIISGNVFSSSLPVLTLNNTNLPPYTTKESNGSIDKVIKEAFNRAGVGVQLVRQPPERGLLNANSGKLDGELSRIGTISSAYPNLVKVPEVLMRWKFSVFSKRSNLNRNWDDIKNNSIAHIKGWKIYEKKLEGSQYVTVVDNAEQLFELLALDRVESVLYERWMGQEIIKNMGLKYIHVYDEDLEARDMYIYLYKSHRSLIPGLSKALRELKKEGLYNQDNLQ